MKNNDFTTNNLSISFKRRDLLIFILKLLIILLKWIHTYTHEKKNFIYRIELGSNRKKQWDVFFPQIEFNCNHHNFYRNFFFLNILSKVRI